VEILAIISHFLLLFRLRYLVHVFKVKSRSFIMTDVIVALYPELLCFQFCTNAENFMLLSPSEQFLLFSQLSSCTITAISRHWFWPMYNWL